MSGSGPIWRSILWVERFLPTPRNLPLTPEQSVAARRRAVLVPLVVLPAALMPSLLHDRHELGAMIRQNVVALQQVFVGLAIVSALAVVVAGMVTWRRETGR